MDEADSGDTVTAVPPTASGTVSAQQQRASSALRGFLQRTLQGLSLEQGADIALKELRGQPVETQPAWYIVPPRAASLAFGFQSATLDILTVRAFDFLENTLDGLKEEAEDEIALNRVVASSAIAVTTGLSVGYVAWLLRSGVLLSSLLSSMPAWRILDPLPVLAGKLDDFEEEDEESLETIIERSPQTAADDAQKDAPDSADVKET